MTVSIAATPKALTSTGAASAITRGPMAYIMPAAPRVSRAPKMVSTGIMGLPRLPIAVPTVRPTTAAGSKQAKIMSASETRNCTCP